MTDKICSIFVAYQKVTSRNSQRDSKYHLGEKPR